MSAGLAAGNRQLLRSGTWENDGGSSGRQKPGDGPQERERRRDEKASSSLIQIQADHDGGPVTGTEIQQGLHPDHPAIRLVEALSEVHPTRIRKSCVGFTSRIC